jgi:galactokinase
MTLETKVRGAFRGRFAQEPVVVVRSPGRVNLIGEHTDYNDGFVLPVAINRAVWVAAAPRAERRAVIHTLDLDDVADFGLEPVTRQEVGHWSNYARGVAALLQEKGYAIPGLSATLASDVPIGAGLSSSAALETALALTWQALGGFDIGRVELALLCQQADHRYVGSLCGIMDQYIALLGRRGHALLIDCRSLEYELVPLPLERDGGTAIVVCDSGVSRALAAGSAYNERRASCYEGVRLMAAHLPGIRALRDVSMEQFQELADILPEVVRKRCRHIISENDRTLAGAEALRRGDLAAFGELMKESHLSMRDDYEISLPELDTLVEAAWQVDGCDGSRLTGAGFGGCTVSLVAVEALADFQERVGGAYERAFGRRPAIYTCSVEDGAQELRIQD